MTQFQKTDLSRTNVCARSRALKHDREAVEGDHMKGESWLCPTELDRSRVLDASPRVRTVRTVSSGAVGVALIAAAPWIGWWTLALFAASVLNFLNVERRIHTSPHPERVSAWAIVLTLLLLNGGVALTGGSASPMLSWTVLPAGMVAARFRPHVVIAGLVLTLVLMLIATVGVHPVAALRNPVPLIATLALLTAVVAIVWALQAAELHHRDEASVDPLTGLLNRHALAPRFIELCHQARLTRQRVCLVLCDIDNFKTINDEHGHDRGDAALRDVAYELRKRLRSFELAYRLGGEEFLVVLPGVDSDGGRLVAERLRAAVQHARPAGIPITISIGVSAARGEEVDYDSLFKAADLALYEAKRAGRNRVMVAPDPAKAEPEAAREQPSHPRAALARW
jgi:diguanylate cyclase (GGDEF)-like protein